MLMKDGHVGVGMGRGAPSDPLVRRWTTGIVAGGTAEYERFARETSLAMFRDAPGCLAVVMWWTHERRSVTTVWVDREHLDAFERSSRYVDTVWLIASGGFLSGQQTVIVEPAQLVWLADRGGQERGDAY